MKNSKLRRALLLVASAVLLVCVSVGATLAYLTDDDSVKNTFTVGKVEINLDETSVDENGKSDGNRTETGNGYNLLPGQEYDKDPTVTVKANSEDCYVRIKVTVSNITELKLAFPGCVHTINGVEYFDLRGMVEGYDASIWAFVEPVTADDPATYEFRYVGPKATNGVVPKSASNTVLEDLFTKVVVPGETTSKQMANLEGKEVTIDIVAEAIQATGFASADAAWDEFVAPEN